MKDIIVPAGMSYEFYTELTSGSKNVQETPKVGGKIANNRNFCNFAENFYHNRI